MKRIITLTTDFGLDDPYVGIMKGVILGINPDAVIVDITHSVGPQDVVEGAFVLSTSFAYFPTSTIHVVVVDPGVGGRRAALLIETSHGLFIGPDNGVLSWATGFAPAGRTSGRLVADIKHIFELTNRRCWLPEISSTFHGRDIFAPVAAHLSVGAQPSQCGREVGSYHQLPWPTVERKADGSVVGSVLHVDRFGNLITNLPAEYIGDGQTAVKFEVAGQSVVGLSRAYQGNGLLALIGSSGYLEIAVAGGSAAATLGVSRGAEVVVRQADNG